MEIIDPQLREWLEQYDGHLIEEEIQRFNPYFIGYCNYFFVICLPSPLKCFNPYFIGYYLAIYTGTGYTQTEHKVIALIMSIVLSIIGVWLELSWYAYIIAIILSVGFCAAPIDNEINATISGFIVGLFLGILESPLFGVVYGSFAVELYEYYVGTHLITLIILGVVVAFLSNMFLKKPVTNIVTKIKKMM